MNIEKIWSSWEDAEKFSGVFSVRGEQGKLFEKCCGLRNRSEALPNNPDTAFGIASGTKLFTGLAVCKLIEEGMLSLEDKLWDLLPYDLGRIDPRVTVYHLLTHTSGIGDYIDEEAPDCCQQEQLLCSRYPVHLWERLEYYLQMITPLAPKFEPGARFGYSNAGFVMLGLVIEAAAALPYQQFLEEEIFLPLGLRHTGFYRMDSLPANTALGYTGGPSSMRTNMFSLPVVGGSDGGLYSCAQDLDAVWRSLFEGHLLSADMLQAFLKPQVSRGAGQGYGLGVYCVDNGGAPAYYAVGGDAGVDFFTAYIPRLKISATSLGNSELNNPLLDALIADILA